VPARGRGRRARGEKASAVGREGAAALAAARRRSRTRVVAPGRDSSNAQEDLARGLVRDRRAHRGQPHRDGPTLAGRRPHRAEADQGGGHGRVSGTEALAALANIGSYPTEPYVSVT